MAERLTERYPSVLLDRADEPPPPEAIPIGYSMGGRIVLHAALANPGRWPALVLVGVSAGIDDPVARRKDDDELAGWIQRKPIADIVAMWETQAAFATQSPELVAAQREGRLSFEPPELAYLLRAFGQGVMPPIWDRLSALDVPVLLLTGALDEKYLAAGRRMASLLPRGTLETIPDAGHAPQLEAPEAVADAIDSFLGELRS
ncbi:MAG TPA: alpha/beta fold hydrolase [Thermoleophilaceae bacterium]|nr:alpha/beta fold hydrolase [Thermoleophilaceae bacterium]